MRVRRLAFAKGGEASITQESPSLGTRLSYGAGSAAFGIKDAGLQIFLLLFYTQIIGVPAPLVGLALTVALVLDAISDPIVGYWSDNFRSKWGRRHPFMYASAIPVAVCYFLIWTPPVGWDHQALFWYLLVMAVLVRTFLTFFETPSAALGPELTRDYDQRSALQSWRSFFGWTGGNAMTVMMFLFVFPAFNTPEWRTTLTFANPAVTQHLGFSVAWRWQDAFDWTSTFNQMRPGRIEAYSVVDAQVSYRLPAMRSVLKVGGTNIFNNQIYQAYGSPSIGATYYVSITFEQLFQR